ncbi:MAG: iron ABC transporter permease [Pseudomonadota bacterium]
MAARPRPLAVLAALAALCAGAFCVALMAGSAALSPGEVWAALTGGASGDASDTARAIVLDIRWPRALAALGIGALLALAGVLMQVLLRNPLADPYILGISSGAAVGALAAVALSLALPVRHALAFAGALTVMGAVYAVARADRGFAPLRLLLTGVVIAAGLNAVISLLLATSDDTGLRGMLFWLMGDLSATRSGGALVLLAALATALATVLYRALDVLALGHAQAVSVGLPVRRTRVLTYVVASLLTAVSVSAAGSIGFVGLVVPHAVRLLTGPSHRVLVPGAALGGGALLLIADTLSRTVLAPRQLPVGALTALIGVPVFLYLMARHARRRL